MHMASQQERIGCMHMSSLSKKESVACTWPLNKTETVACTCHRLDNFLESSKKLTFSRKFKERGHVYFVIL